MRLLAAFNTLLKTTLMLTLVGGLGWGGFTGYRYYRSYTKAVQAHEVESKRQQAEIRRLIVQRDDAQRQARRLEAANRLLKVDRRVAQIMVVDQQGVGNPERLATQFKFVEVDKQGNPLDVPRLCTIQGDVLYVDAWVVKFDDLHVESGDPLKGTSVCLFRRLFGEKQSPEEGIELDPIGTRPKAYASGGETSETERAIWSDFWEFANDPKRQEAAGVRAAHGEAASIKLKRGKLYKLILRASDGLSIVPEDLPAVLERSS
jgi:hypothetical protein